MTPDQASSRLAMQGVACIGGRYEPEGGEPGGLLITNGLLPPSWNVTPYIAHPEAVAQALVDVAEAARVWSVDDSSDYYAKLVEIRRALKRLEDAAKAASSSAEGAT